MRPATSTIVKDNETEGNRNGNERNNDSNTSEEQNYKKEDEIQKDEDKISPIKLRIHEGYIEVAKDENNNNLMEVVDGVAHENKRKRRFSSSE